MPIVARLQAPRRQEPFVPLALFLLAPLLLALGLGAMSDHARATPASLVGAPAADVR